MRNRGRRKKRRKKACRTARATPGDGLQRLGRIGDPAGGVAGAGVELEIVFISIIAAPSLSRSWRPTEVNNFDARPLPSKRQGPILGASVFTRPAPRRRRLHNAALDVRVGRADGRPIRAKTPDFEL